MQCQKTIFFSVYPMGASLAAPLQPPNLMAVLQAKKWMSAVFLPPPPPGYDVATLGMCVWGGVCA